MAINTLLKVDFRCVLNQLRKVKQLENKGVALLAGIEPATYPPEGHVRSTSPQEQPGDSLGNSVENYHDKSCYCRQLFKLTAVGSSLIRLK